VLKEAINPSLAKVLDVKTVIDIKKGQTTVDIVFSTVNAADE
jgi:hypothetical protein